MKNALISERKKNFLVFLLIFFPMSASWAVVEIENRTPYEITINTGLHGNSSGYCPYPNVTIYAALPKARFINYVKDGAPHHYPAPPNIPAALPGVDGKLKAFPSMFLNYKYVSPVLYQRNVQFVLLPASVKKSVMLKKFESLCLDYANHKLENLFSAKICSIPWPSDLMIVGQTQRANFTPCIDKTLGTQVYDSMNIVDKTGTNPGSVSLSMNVNWALFPRPLTNLVIVRSRSDQDHSRASIEEARSSEPKWGVQSSGSTYSLKLEPGGIAFDIYCSKDHGETYWGQNPASSATIPNLIKNVPCFNYHWLLQNGAASKGPWPDWVPPGVIGKILTNLGDFLGVWGG